MMLEIKKNEVQRIQEALEKSNHIYISCFLQDGTPITQFGGTQIEQDFLLEHFPKETQEYLLHSFVDEGVENVIFLPGDEAYIMFCGIAIRDIHQHLLGAWLIMGVASDLCAAQEQLPSVIYRCSKSQFEETVALIETISHTYFTGMQSLQEQEEKLQKLMQDQKQQKQVLQKNTVLTEILRMLESENGFAKIAEDMLREAGEYLRISSSSLLRVNTDDTTVDMISEWNTQNNVSLMDSFLHIEKEQLPFMTGRPYSISSDSLIPDNFSDFFAQHNIQAGVFLPLFINGKCGMYLAFTMVDEPRHWTGEETQFLNDVKRVLQAILVKRITKNSLVSSYSSLEAILKNAGCGVCIVDVKEKNKLYVNEVYRQIVQDEEDAAALEQLLTSPEEYAKPEEFYGNHSTHWYELTFNTIHWVDGREVRLCTIYDITHMKRYQKKIEHQANVDYLTGLYNRIRYEKDMKEEIRRAVQAADQGALLYLDLDDFKNINDGLGHYCGDLLLKNVASSMQAIRGIGKNCYRIGGDEFAILIPYDVMKQLPDIMKRIQAVFSKPWNLDGTEYYCTMSMGIVHFPKDGVNPQMLLQRADIALYEAKQKGKNRMEHYSQETTANPVQRLDLEKNLRLAVEGGCQEFQVYYQPMMKVYHNQTVCCGAEALLRWNSPSLGMLMPMDFIPLAEYLGLIVPIGEYVLNEACDRCKYWNDFGHPEYKVNVNLSVVQLLQNNIVDTMKRAVERSGIAPKNLTVEVTEGLAMHDMERMSQILERIKQLGVRVALDDFGTGYSSLSHLQNMPLDVIKIDRCFVEHMDQDLFSQAFVKSVTELAKVLQVNVCVEGIETKEQLHMLEECPPDMLQGYLFGRPMTDKELEDKFLV